LSSGFLEGRSEFVLFVLVLKVILKMGSIHLHRERNMIYNEVVQEYKHKTCIQNHKNPQKTPIFQADYYRQI
jgi:hypothetical protein